MRTRFKVALTAVVASILISFTGVGAANASMQSDVVGAVNAVRGGGLNWDPTLAAAAQSWADRMPAGTVNHSGYQRANWIIAENVAWAPGSDAQSVVAAWAASPGHNANMRGSQYNSAGGGYNANGAFVLIVGSYVAPPPPPPAPPVQSNPTPVAPPTQNQDEDITPVAPPVSSAPAASTPATGSTKPGVSSGGGSSSGSSSSGGTKSGNSSSGGSKADGGAKSSGGSTKSSGSGKSSTKSGSKATTKSGSKASGGSKTSGTKSSATTQGASSGSSTDQSTETDGDTSSTSDDQEIESLTVPAWDDESGAGSKSGSKSPTLRSVELASATSQQTSASSVGLLIALLIGGIVMFPLRRIQRAGSLLGKK